MSLVAVGLSGLTVPVTSTGPTPSTLAKSFKVAWPSCSVDKSVMVPPASLMVMLTGGETERSVNRTLRLEITTEPTETFGREAKKELVALDDCAACGSWVAFGCFFLFGGVASLVS